jgi:hypothetical protein
MSMTNQGSSSSGGYARFSASLLAWGLLATSLLLIVAGKLVERAADSFEGGPEEVALIVAFMAFPAFGALIASRQPTNAIGWIFLGIGFLVALLVLASAYGRYGLVLHPDDDLPGTTAAAWIENWAWFPLILTIPTLLLLLFPTGRPPSRRWTPVAWAAGALIGLITVLSMLEGRLVVDGVAVSNPIGIDGLGDVEDMDLLFVPIFPLVILSVASLFFRYRSGGDQERLQLKWVTVAAAFLGVGMILSDVFQLPGITLPLFLAMLPASVGIAMLKYHLYDIDVVINRTLVYGLLTAVLATVYFGMVIVLQQVTEVITPDSDLAIVGSTLAVAALFRPARTRVQSFIDRRFYRAKYDTAKTLERFSTRLQEEIELNALSDELVGVVGRTMQPKHVSLWLREPG